MALRELLDGGRARLLPDDSGPQVDDDVDPASSVFAALADSERDELNERAAHVREALTGYRSGSAELPATGEPREQYDPRMSLTSRYTAKAAELGVSLRTIKQWVADFRRHGEAGLARKQSDRQKPLGSVDDKWTETALEVMVEQTDQSGPTDVRGYFEACPQIGYGTGQVSESADRSPTGYWNACDGCCWHRDLQASGR